MLDKLSFLLWRFKFDRSGVTAVEYGVIAAAIVVGIVVVIYAVGDEVTSAFTDLETEMKSN